MRIFIFLGVLIAAGCTRPITEFGQAELDRRNAEMVIAAAADISADGLTPADYDAAAIKTALLADDSGAAMAASAQLFMKIAKDMSEGTVPPGNRARWHIAQDTVDTAAAQAMMDKAFRDHNIAATLNAFAPIHPQYLALKAALAKTSRDDVETVAKIRLNMERWRWMPHDLGPDYIFVNVPAFELIVVRNGAVVDRRRVIVGAVKSPTPQFAAIVTGVVLNPTWFVPSSIVAESVGALLKNNPQSAEQRGYYLATDGGVRQKPGPDNALGQMKLVMPNPYSIFLHDTPTRTLFQRDARALSHGCIRVDGALDFANVLLAPGLDKAAIVELVEAGTTNTVILERPIPIYAVYFTAYARDDGSIAFPADIYGLDAPLLPRFGAHPGADGAGNETPETAESCPEGPAE